MAIEGRNANIKVMNNAEPIPFTEQTTIANATRTEYQIQNRIYRYWSREYAVVVETSPDGSTWTTVEDYRIAHAGGKIIFDTARAIGTQARVSGRYVTVTTVAECYEASLTIQNALIDITTLDGDGWRRKLSTIIDASGTLSGFYDIDGLVADNLLFGVPVVVEIDFDGTDLEGDRFAFYGQLTGDDIFSGVEEAADDTVSFESDGDIIVKQKAQVYWINPSCGVMGVLVSDGFELRVV